MVKDIHVKEDDGSIFVFIKLSDLEKLLEEYKNKPIKDMEGIKYYVLQYDTLKNYYIPVGGQKW